MLGVFVFYVYFLRSLSFPCKKYIGFTKNLKARLVKHNEGGSPFTARYRPWKVVTYIGFQTERGALAFEKYLKTYSGRAYAQKHFWIE